jgi:4'-phosphopantetheinyl transferase
MSRPRTSERVDVWIVPEAEAGPGLLSRAVAAFAGVSAAAVILDSRCDFCDRDHGKPRVVTPRMPDGREIVVSKSRAGGLVAVAAGCGGELGIDLESVSKMSRARVDEVAFAPSERDTIDDAAAEDRQQVRTAIFSLKEAYLKATGQGLRTDLTLIDTRSLPANVHFQRLSAPTGDLILFVVMIGAELEYAPLFSVKRVAQWPDAQLPTVPGV